MMASAFPSDSKVEDPVGPPGEPDGRGKLPLPTAPPAPPQPPKPPDQPRKVPLFLIRKQQLTGADPHLPSLVKQQHRGQTLNGAYLLCIDKSGHVRSVATLASIPGGDEEIVKVLQTWTYKEQPIPVCFVQNFEFVVE